MLSVFLSAGQMAGWPKFEPVLHTNAEWAIRDRIKFYRLGLLHLGHSDTDEHISKIPSNVKFQ